jgi:hypothetical protein
MGPHVRGYAASLPPTGVTASLGTALRETY